MQNDGRKNTVSLTYINDENIPPDTTFMTQKKDETLTH